MRTLSAMFVILSLVFVLSACGGDSKKGAYEYAVSQAKEAFAKPAVGVKEVEPYSKDMVTVKKEHDSNIYSAYFKIVLNDGKTKKVYVSEIRLAKDHWTYGGMRYE